MGWIFKAFLLKVLFLITILMEISICTCLCHSVHSPENYANSEVRNRTIDPGGDRLFERRGDQYYYDVTEKAGIYSSRIGFGLGVGISDINKDGYPDIYVGNDFHENDYLYINNGDGTFLESIENSCGHTSQFSMGLDIADINNDGWNDILTLDMMPKDEQVKRSSVPSDTYEIYNSNMTLVITSNCLAIIYNYIVEWMRMGIPIFSEIGQLIRNRGYRLELVGSSGRL